MFVNELTNLEIDVELAINNNIKNTCSDQVCVAALTTFISRMLNLSLTFCMERTGLWCSVYSFCNGLSVFCPGLVEDIMVGHH